MTRASSRRKLAARLEERGRAADHDPRPHHARCDSPAKPGSTASREVVAAVKRIPVIGNGDVRTPQDARRMMRSDRLRRRDDRPRGAVDAVDFPRHVELSHDRQHSRAADDRGEVPADARSLLQHGAASATSGRRRSSSASAISWYAKQMNPCTLLRDEMRTINSPRISRGRSADSWNGGIRAVGGSLLSPLNLG